jgi:hypothetical protein
LCHPVLRRILFGTVPFNVRYYVSLSTALIPQLQLRHLRSVVCVQSFGQSAFTSTEGVTVRGDASTFSENHQRLHDVDEDNKAQIPLASVPAPILETPKIRIVMCVLRDHSNMTDCAV